MLNGPFASEDADFRPLLPPVIIESENTFPLPGRFVQVPMSADQAVTFRVCVAWASREPLEQRVYIDRQAGCGSFEACGIAFYNELRTVPFTDAGICRIVTFTVALAQYTRLAGRTCVPIDLYVSPEFKSPFGNEATMPSRTGNVAHARWYIVRPDATMGGVPPRVDECCAGGPATGGMCTN